MKKKRLAAFSLALVIILSCGFSAFALSGVSIGDVLSIIASVDISKYTSYSEQEWNTLSSAERAEQINFVISDQNGKSYITDTSDFINDPALSYEYYNLLTNNSLISDSLPGGSATGNFFSKQYLEQNGLANFDMGYFSSGGSGGHFSGKFDDGTVADTLNDDFLDYLQDNPLDVGFTSVYYQTNDGYKVSFYINYDPESVWTKYDIYTRIVDPTNNIVFDGIPYTKNYSYGDNDISKTSSWLSRFALDYNIVTVYKSDGTIQEVFSLNPWIPDKEGGSSTPVSNDPLATGVDENGNKIQFNINSDGVTYEGSTYNYNDDNSVTINGNTYYISVDPSTIDPDYYKNFLGDTINNYYNYYTTDGKEFDPTDIISSLKSIFSSLEAFRSYCYNQLKQIYNTVHNGFNSLRSSISNLGRKLDDIIKQLKSINQSLDELTDEQKEQNRLGYLELISKFKNKVGWSNLETSMTNISTAFFGSRSYSVSDTGEIGVSIATSDNTVVSSSMPSLYIEFMGQQYNLYSCVGYLGSGIETIKGFIRIFLWVGFIISAFRSFPSIIGGVSSVQDHSNNIVIDKTTGEVKKGG